MNRNVVWTGASLVAVSSIFFLWKTLVLGMPILPTEPEGLWRVELEVVDMGCMARLCEPIVLEVGGLDVGRSAVVTLESFQNAVEVRLVALQADEGFVLPEQVVGHRAVRFVAGCATLLHGRVLEDERSLLGLMAGVAEVVVP